MKGGENRNEGAKVKEECKNGGNTKKRVENDTNQKTSKESKGKIRVEPKQRDPKHRQVKTKPQSGVQSAKKTKTRKETLTHPSYPKPHNAAA